MINLIIFCGVWEFVIAMFSFSFKRWHGIIHTAQQKYITTTDIVFNFEVNKIEKKKILYFLIHPII